MKCYKQRAVCVCVEMKTYIDAAFVCCCVGVTFGSCTQALFPQVWLPNTEHRLIYQ